MERHPQLCHRGHSYSPKMLKQNKLYTLFLKIKRAVEIGRVLIVQKRESRRGASFKGTHSCATGVTQEFHNSLVKKLQTSKNARKSLKGVVQMLSTIVNTRECDSFQGTQSSCATSRGPSPPQRNFRVKTFTCPESMSG